MNRSFPLQNIPTSGHMTMHNTPVLLDKSSLLPTSDCFVSGKNANLSLMSAPRKLPSGLWFVQVDRRGQRPSRAFASKTAAQMWKAETEKAILDGKYGNTTEMTLGDLLDRYKAEVTPLKKTRAWEGRRIEAFKADRIASVKLRALDTNHFSEWQQRRLQEVSGPTIRRERTVFNNMFVIAANEWKLIDKNPLKGVRKTDKGRARDRIASPEEIAVLLAAASPQLGRAIEIALETGMRQGEIASNPKVTGRVAFVGETKSDRHQRVAGREVPLSPRAVELLQTPVGLTAASISTRFRLLAMDCGIKGLTFHDLRHCSASRLCKKLDVWELCKMFGWTDPKMCLNTYYKQDPEATARKLD